VKYGASDHTAGKYSWVSRIRPALFHTNSELFLAMDCSSVPAQVLEDAGFDYGDQSLVREKKSFAFEHVPWCGGGCGGDDYGAGAYER